MRKITKIIVHCTDTKNGVRVPLKEIEAWHLARGFHKIGYHYVIQPNGDVEQGRDLSEVGAHCEGENLESVGVCLVGRDSFTWHQLNRLLDLYKQLAFLSDTVGFRCIYGHREFPSAIKQKKTCPNIEPKDLLLWCLTENPKAIQKYAMAYVGE